MVEVQINVTMHSFQIVHYFYHKICFLEDLRMDKGKLKELRKKVNELYFKKS